MKTWVHVLFSIILTVGFYPIFSWKVIFILIGGILVDIDHYFWYIYKVKDFDIIKCYKYFNESFNINRYDKHMGSLMIFHTSEFLLLIVFVGFYSEIAYIFLIGALFHYILDLIFFCFISKCFIANHSIGGWIIKNKSNLLIREK